MKTLIAVPCMDYLEADFVECLTNLILDPQTPGEIDVRYLKASLIYDARNQIMRYVLEHKEYDYVLWLDSDMTFDSDLLRRLMEDMEGRLAVTGLCFGRRPPFKPCVYNRLEVQQDGKVVLPVAKNWMDYPRDQIFEVEACGFACVLMRREVLEVMAIYGVPFYPVGGMGEDLTFCWRANKMGIRFHCDSRLKIGHIMRMSVGIRFCHQGTRTTEHGGLRAGYAGREDSTRPPFI